MSVEWKETLNFLVVDDIPLVRSTIKDMLMMLGYRNITEAEDGVKAWIKLTSKKIDVAIVDWNMPHMNGIDLLRKTRADNTLSNIPFIMISGEVGDDTIAEAAETEIDAYIIKPFVAATLDEKIIQVLKRKRNPLPLDTHLKQAYVYTHSGQFNQAMAELKKATLIQSKDPRVSYGYAELYKQMGMADASEKAYKKSLHYEPMFVKAHDGLADLYKKTGEDKKLLTALNEALSISPRNASRQAGFGKLCLELGKTDEAKKAFRAALKAEPGNTVVHNEVAEALLAKDMNEDAAVFFQAVLKTNPEDIHVYNRLGIAFRKQGKYEEAIAEYIKAIKVAPRDENLYFNLGRAYLEAGRKEDALEQFRKALDYNPAFAEARDMIHTMTDGQ